MDNPKLQEELKVKASTIVSLIEQTAADPHEPRTNMVGVCRVISRTTQFRELKGVLEAMGVKFAYE